MNYAPAKERFVGEPTPLTKEDMGKLFEGAWKPLVSAERLRHSHHRIARMMAAGLRDFEITEKTGYKSARLSVLKASPAFVDLVAHYKSLVDEGFKANMDDFASLATHNMIRAQEMIADTLSDAEDEGVKLPLRDLIALQADAADRFGYGKKSSVLNTNVDFAAILEKAVRRSKTATRGDEVLEIEADA